MPPQNTLELAENGANEKDTNGALVTNGKEHLKESEDVQEVATAPVVVPPDGGWGWVVMMASFCCNIIVDGIIFSAGALLQPVKTEFGVTDAEVALVTSLLSGFYLMAGPFVSALANRWGFRPVTMMGATIAAVGFSTSYFAGNIVHLYITYGIIGGIGFCLIYMPSVITVGYYFERWRALATGISLCGSGIGTFIFAPLSDYLITNQGWRITLVIQGAIILLCVLFAICFRPIKPIQVPIDQVAAAEKEKLQEDALEKRLAHSVPGSVNNTWMGSNHNTHYPTASEVFRGSGQDLNGKRASEDRETQTPLMPAALELRPVGETDEADENGALLDGETKPVIVPMRRHTVTEREPVSRRVSTTSNPRPLYRDDIFFSGSVQRLPQYQSQTSLGYHMSVTRLPTQQDVREEKEPSCRLCPQVVTRTLATMLDISLLKSPTFMLLALSGFLTMMGFFIPFMYLVARAVAQGMDKQVAVFVVSSIGISNTVARIGCGLISSIKGVSPLHVNNIAITLGGVATIFSGYSMSEAFQFTYAAVFGIAIACFSALRSIIVVDLMGLEKLTNAFGILMLFQGIAAAIGSPIAGAFMSLTNSHDAAFWLSGILMTISALIIIPLNLVKRWEDNRKPSSNSSA
ncbi:monocarboxylate transporter 3 [Phlebotomus argentipes]|uniref:monocarboxylate transporter 3 n=1 Tax=Phlebotomus argentipes TaxID=94469 RepID=UPI0028930C3F|nr:monocarboxylate transporter 3 [Phlebotomus argentipes]XP_059622308.1 monocarboxylate transporter 3 [Phlebotomus argentipes]